MQRLWILVCTLCEIIMDRLLFSSQFYKSFVKSLFKEAVAKVGNIYIYIFASVKILWNKTEIKNFVWGLIEHWSHYILNGETVVFHFTVVIMIWSGENMGSIVILNHKLLFHDSFCTAYLYMYIMLSTFIVNKGRVVIRTISC